MNIPFDRNHPYARKLLIVGSTAVLCAACFAGCTGKTPEATEPSINIIDSTTPIVTTAPPTTEAKRENVAVVKEQLNVRTSPSVESNIINQLDAGEEVEVLRVEPVNGVEWAYVKQGWIPTELLDMTNVTITSTANAATPANPDATEPPATTAPPPTEAPEAQAGNYNSNTNTTGGDKNNNTANGKMGVVIASELNIRDKAGTDGKVVGGLKYGDRVTISESKDGWGKIDKGWISLEHVYQDGETGKNGCKGIVTGGGLNIRSGPGTNYDSVATLNKFDRVVVLNRLTLGDYTWGCTDKGWVRMDYVYVDGTSTNEAASGTITGDALNIRSGPGTKYESVGAYSSGTQVNILAQFEIGEYTWGCTDKGWIRMDYVELN